ncbi:hypothetical protein BDR26DRAFT_878987 [Obelidium mucronatum]|nr:hypothetical protein BDR26DRAFT_878987 [Obelidium mucronatum]
MKCRKRDKNAQTGRYTSCTETCSERISNSGTNPGRPYWSCPTHNFSHWTGGPATPQSQPSMPIRDHPASPSNRYSPYSLIPSTPSKASTAATVPPPYNMFADEEYHHIGGGPSTQTPPSSQSTSQLGPTNSLNEEDPDLDEAISKSFSDAVTSATTLLTNTLAENRLLRTENRKLKNQIQTSSGESEQVDALQKEVDKLKRQVHTLKEALNALGD